MNSIKISSPRLLKGGNSTRNVASRKYKSGLSTSWHVLSCCCKLEMATIRVSDGSRCILMALSNRDCTCKLSMSTSSKTKVPLRAASIKGILSSSPAGPNNRRKIVSSSSPAQENTMNFFLARAETACSA